MPIVEDGTKISPCTDISINIHEHMAYLKLQVDKQPPLFANTHVETKLFQRIDTESTNNSSKTPIIQQ